MFQMTLYNAVVLYVPSLSLQSVFEISELVSIGAVGASCIIYSTMGGIKGVIWTDFFQAGLMYASLICIIIIGTLQVGGIGPLIDTAINGNRLSFADYFNVDLQTRHTIFTIALGGTIVNIFMNGCNQIQVQRALSLPTLRLAQWSQVIAAVCSVVVGMLSSIVGLILYNTYKDCDPYENKEIDKPDSLLIYYVDTKLDRVTGLRGIFISGIFAATLSTLSSFQNSMSALLLEDIVKPAVLASTQKSISAPTQAKLSKLFSFLFGVVCIGCTFLVGRINGLLQSSLLLFGALGAPFMTSFYLGVCTRFVNTLGILVGMLAGLSLGIYVQMYQLFYMPPLVPSAPISVASCSAQSGTDPFTGGETHALTSTLGGIQSNNSTFSAYQEQLSHLSRLGTMSYLWLPVISMIFTSFVACLVSILSGGCQQEVEDKYLATWLRRGLVEQHEQRANIFIQTNGISNQKTKASNLRSVSNGMPKDLKQQLNARTSSFSLTSQHY